MRYLLVAFVFLTLPLCAQKNALTLENVTYSNFIKDRRAFALSNPATGDLVLVIPDKKTVGTHLFDKDFNKLNELTAESLRIKFKDIIGYRVSKQHYTTLFATENRQFFGVVDFDFETGETVSEQIDVEVKGESFLEAVSYNNRFFMLSVNDDFDGLILRELNEDRTFTRMEIPFNAPGSFQDLLCLKNDPEQLGERRVSFLGNDYLPKIVEIDNTNPNSLETTSEMNKLYTQDNQLIFTFDNFADFTLVYFLDLEDFSVSEKRFAKEKVSDVPFERSNSFLFEDKLFQLGVDNDKMAFTITDFDSGENIKIYRATKERIINFKNSQLLQKNGTFQATDQVRVLDETSQFLRKITNGKPGIAVQKIDGKYQVTLGGTQAIGGGGGGGMMMGGGTQIAGGSSGGISMSVVYNPTYVSYGSYTATKSIYIHSLFNNEFEHIEGFYMPNVFDKIETFEGSIKGSDAEEVFYHNNKVYFGYYFKKSETYNFVAF